MIKKLRGTSLDFFELSGGDVKFENTDGTYIEALNEADALIKLRVSGVPDSGQHLEDAANWGDVQSYAAKIEGSFTGASPPSPGANTGKFLICHTDGGSYSAGDIVYDDGTSLLDVVNCNCIATLVEVTGGIDLPQWGWYVDDSGTWTAIGGGAGGGSPIKVDFDYTDTVEVVSNQQVPDGAVVERRMLVITTAFDDVAATASATLKGTPAVPLVATGDFRLSRARQYGNDDLIIVAASEGGNVGVTITPGTATEGAGYFMVWFSTPNS